ncbi:MAG: Thivi_2564 family membrane protein [Silvibacterium sp.]
MQHYRILLWLVNRFIPMQSSIKSILNGVVVICVVLRSLIGASRYQLSRSKSHGRHARAWRQPFHRARSVFGSRCCTSADSTLVHYSDWSDNTAFA